MLQTLLRRIATNLLGSPEDADSINLSNGVVLKARDTPEVECFRRSRLEAIEDWYQAGLPATPVGPAKCLNKLLVGELRITFELLMRTDGLPGWHACRQAADGVASILRDFEREVGTTQGGIGLDEFHRAFPEQTVGRNPLGSFDAAKHHPESYRQRLYENMEDIASAIGRQHLPQHRRNFADLMLYIGCLRVDDPMG